MLRERSKRHGVLNRAPRDAFLVVILLSNVLTATLTDSYGVVKNERAAMVFWSKRLDFVAKMDAIERGEDHQYTFDSHTAPSSQ